MAAIEIFSSSVTYKYKSKIYSCASTVVFLLIVLSLLTPLLIIYHTGGFLMKNRMHAETPDVHFEYKYLLLAEVDPYEKPIVCSTFKTYKENAIEDHCTLVKVLENDLNRDGQKDSLKFEAYFYTNKPVKSLRLLLFFNFQLKHLIQATIESVGVFDQVLNQEAQEIRFFGDLELRQKGLLRSEGLYENYNHSIELADYSLPDLLLYTFNRKFSARITNERVTWRAGFSSDETVAVIGELFYAENFIFYQPSVWEELKWAWIQYLSCLLVFAYVAKHVLVFLFTNRYLSTYIVKPWMNK
ncbi:transmembrane protein 231-like isoform X2 [Pseudomyrmex gracilis]|uniref:transmembrane protein 231-like isoform X2 n=1 Tax=Pseudomyrmex gracilis TaxID=219809 RepID=UPI0009957852|nr:transmembrane protein 231-like isoform X2 [Pseudomyrmex gracilis]XP_020283113.1 transmembrane protein 231-like isoform X2 [Pseudomyrmex gracilis]